MSLHATTIRRQAFKARSYRRDGGAAVLFVVVVGLLFSAAPALAATPWWGLTSGSWPTNLHAGVAKDEVQELTVSATSGDYFVGAETQQEAQAHHDLLEKLLPFNATAEEVQKQLESAYPGITLAVSAEVVTPSEEAEHIRRYLITFPSQHKRLIDASTYSFFEFECKILEETFGFGSCGAEPGRIIGPLKGGNKSAPEVTEKAQGRPDGKIVVTAENMGDAPADGSVTPVVLEDAVPGNLEVVGVTAEAGEPGFAFESGRLGPVVCSMASAHRARCVFEGTFEHAGVVLPKVVPSYELIEMRIEVRVAGTSSPEANAVTVSGGGAKLATLSKPLSMGSGNGFGVADYQLIAEEEGGAPSTQAGVHPFQLTTITTLATSEAAPDLSLQQPAGMTKDVTFQLPPGLIGNPTPLPQCTVLQFTTEEQHQKTTHNECEAKTAIGVATITYDTPKAGFTTGTVPVFNVEPRAGEPARFGFEILKTPTFIDTSVRAGGDYGVTVTVPNITEIVGFISSKVTFWGVPGDPSHDNSRGWRCTLEGETTGCSANVAKPPPFLSMPTSCTGPMSTTVQADSWAEPDPAHPFEPPLFAEYQMGGLDSCNRLQFSPEIRVTPDGTEASKPTGLNVDVHVPQTAALNAEGLAESAVKDITVALPEGVAVNPAGGDGLAACSEGLAGFTGFSEPEHAATFSGTLPDPLQPGVNFCADASKIGEVTVKSPLLPPTQPLKGFVYLATQNENPFGSLIALYLVAKDPISGVVFKSVGETHLTPSGQVIGVFDHNPQLAFEDAELHFFGEERAPLSSPAHCGAYTTNATFVPWSGTPNVNSTSTFNITSGPNGAPCPGPTLPFSPSLTGGSTNINAGAFSPLVTTIGREDGQQDMQSVVLSFPPGVSGSLAGVKLCPEAQANEGTCGPESLIGETIVSAGVGSDPVTVTGGKVYLTESYKGATFGLSIVNPVKAGPFDLEHDTSNPAQNPACDCIVVRGKLALDPVTAALTFTSDPSGPHAIPHLIDGIPVQIKRVNVTINREHFTLNPTNCSPMSLTGTIGSDEGASSPVSVPFQATNCAVLKYTPTLTVSTAAKATKANGASLVFKIAYPKGAVGSQSWFKYAKFELPKQLPARLTTLQKACLAATFESNRSACPPASLIGHAVVHTPVLPVPLAGPVYFVSHGGAKFPDAVVVLQGYGITVQLTGETFISKAGITSATFASTPDVPFESIEVTVPQGPFSEFGANLPAKAHGSFCGQKLVMPIVFKAQNGLEVHRNTPVGVTGCGKAKTRAQKLKAALKACHKKHNRSKRKACERQAKKRYGPAHKKKK
jgi:hypothetical protein